MYSRTTSTTASNLSARFLVGTSVGRMVPLQHHPVLKTMVQHYSTAPSPTQDLYFQKYEEKIKKKLLESEQEKLIQSISQNIEPNANESKTNEEQKPQTQPLSGTSDQSKTSTNTKQQQKMRTKRNLSDILKMELISTLSKDEIAHIWTQYHSSSKTNFVSAVLTPLTYKNFSSASARYPRFVVPLPRDQGGIEMFYAQYFNYEANEESKRGDTGKSETSGGGKWVLTSLEEFKSTGEAAKPFLEITLFTEIMGDKDIVLLSGEVDLTLLPKREEAQLLTALLQFYYLHDPQQLVKTFNTSPASFDYSLLLSSLSLAITSSPTSPPASSYSPTKSKK